MNESEYLQSSYVANCVCNGFLSYTTILLNSVTIHALRKASSLPQPLKTLLLSLAVSDLGVGLMAQPLYIAYLAMKLEEKPESITTYTALGIAASIFCYASLFGVMTLSADRFLAVHLHLRYQELVTHKRVVGLVISIWVLSACMTLGISLWIPKDIIDLIIVILISLCILFTTLLYYKIYIAVQRHANQIQALQVQQGAQSGEMENTASLRKFAVGAFFVYLAFLVCYLPRSLIIIVFFKSGTSITEKAWRLHTMTLVFLNSSLNPLIYSWKMRHIRHTVMNILRNILRSRN